CIRQLAAIACAAVEATSPLLTNTSSTATVDTYIVATWNVSSVRRWWNDTTV
ncbi:hypothetical protein M513_13920, partial [Trichuris suis]